jgi:hypothetical protein
MSIGIAKRQVTFAGAGSGGGAGSLAITSNPAVIPVASTLNISNEGLLDWLVTNAHTGNDEYQDSLSHWKLLNGYIRDSFKWYGPTGTITQAASATSPLAITANHLDDGHFQGLINADDLNANVSGVVLTANTATSFTGMGWMLRAPGVPGTLRNLKLYFPFSAGGGVAAGQMTITARLSDGSAADVSFLLTTIVSGLQWYRMTIQFKVTGYVSITGIMTTYGDSGSQLGFQAASLF